MRNVIFFAFFIILFSSCRFFGGERIRGNGSIKTETRASGHFKNIDVSSNIDLYLTQDSVNSVKLEADENLLPYIEVYMDGDRVIIRTKKGYNLSGTKDIKAYISAPSFSKLDISGSCSIFSQQPISQQESFDMDISGSADVNLVIKAPKITADLAGSGELLLKGETREFDVSGSGSTSIKSPELMAENVSISFSGSGDADVYASVNLDVSISGSADVTYRGGATVKQSISGSGTITKVQ